MQEQTQVNNKKKKKKKKKKQFKSFEISGEEILFQIMSLYFQF